MSVDNFREMTHLVRIRSNSRIGGSGSRRPSSEPLEGGSQNKGFQNRFNADRLEDLHADPEKDSYAYMARIVDCIAHVGKLNESFEVRHFARQV